MCPACICNALMTAMAVGMTSTSGLAAVAMSRIGCSREPGGNTHAADRDSADSRTKKTTLGSKFADPSNIHSPNYVLLAKEK